MPLFPLDSEGADTLSTLLCCHFDLRDKLLNVPSDASSPQLALDRPSFSLFAANTLSALRRNPACPPAPYPLRNRDRRLSQRQILRIRLPFPKSPIPLAVFGSAPLCLTFGRQGFAGVSDLRLQRTRQFDDSIGQQ